MQTLLSLILALSVLKLGASTVDLEAGIFDLDCLLDADQLTVSVDAMLAGNGTIAAPTTIKGTLAPEGTLHFDSTLAFTDGAILVSRITSNMSLDTLAVAGAVTGSVALRLVQTPGAIPLSQILVAGGTSSVYDAFTVTPNNAWTLTSSDNDLLITDLLGDSDGDSLTDAWAMQYFSTRSVDKDEDGDKDGMSNRAECIAGTDPTKITSRLAMSGITPLAHNGGFEVRWQSASDRHYTLLKSTTLGGEYTPLAHGLQATPPENRYTDDAPSGPRTFYKIRVEE